MDEANNTSAGVNVGDIVECTVEQIMPYGAFVKIAKNGKKGMIHISEVSWSFVKDIKEVLNISDKIQAKIIRIDDRGRIDLSLKQTAEPPKPQTAQKFVKRTPYTNNNANVIVHEKNEGQEKFRQPREQRENYSKPREFRETRDFHEMREAYKENDPEEADSFEKKMASFLKTSEAKITDLNTRNSVRSGKSSRRRNNRDH